MEILAFLKSYVPVRINRFLGDYFHRQVAVQRALRRLNEKTYHLILNNCEHFANWVQKGIPRSDQVEDFGKVLALVGAGVGIAGIATENGKAAGIGLLLAALGVAAISVSEQDNRLS